MAPFLHIPNIIFEPLWHHLLPDVFEAEEVAFMFVRLAEEEGGRYHFHWVEWFPIPPEGFAHRSRYHLELSDETRASAIKRAHDLGACLVEFHSHTSTALAAFSPSDLTGFVEFVPHVWWRLKGRPYAAVVVSRSSFDGFVWMDNPTTPVRLEGIVVGRTTLPTTKLSRLRYEDDDTPAV